MNDYKNYYGALPLCIVPKTPSVTEYCNRNILRNTYLHAFLLFPASSLISNDTKPTTQNYFDLTFVSNFTITECKTNSINTQIKPFVPHLVLVSSHLTCTRQVHKQKHDYKHKKMESLLCFSMPMDARRSGLHVVWLPKLQLLVSMLLAFALCFKARLSAKPLIRNDFVFSCKWNSLSQEWFYSKPRFEREDLELEIDQLL